MTFHLYEGGPLDGRWHQVGTEDGDRFYHHGVQASDGTWHRFTYQRASAGATRVAEYWHWKLTGESATRWHENKEKLL